MARLLVCLAALGLLVAPAWATYTETWNSIPLGADGWLTGQPFLILPMDVQFPIQLSGHKAPWSPVGGISGGCVYSPLSDLVLVNGKGAILNTMGHSVDFLANPIVSVSMLDPVLDQPVSGGKIRFSVLGADGGAFLLDDSLPTPTASWTESTITLPTDPAAWITVTPGNLAAALQNPVSWGWATTGNDVQPQGVIVFDNIQVTPEPATLSLLLVGGLALRRKRMA
jgi:hypothetical protein